MLLERAGQLAALNERLASLRGGTGGVVLIEGEPGIGKTALLDAALLATDGLTVLRARGSELASDLAFGAVQQLLSPALRDADARAACLTGPARLAAPVLGFDTPAVGVPGDPLFGLFWLTVGLSERAPLVLAIDDVHWLDQESARFVGYLAERCAGTAILVIATSRPAQPLGALAALTAQSDVISLPPLTEQATARLAPPGYAAQIHQLTGGNPLFVCELARAAREDPTVDVRALGAATIAGVVRARMRRLSAAAATFADALAVFPDGAEVRDAAVVAGIDEDAAAGVASELIAAHLLADAVPLRFAHPVVRAALYAGLSAPVRQRNHSKAVAQLRPRAAASVIAAHLLAVAPGALADDQAILVAAADVAEQRRAFGAAAQYLTRAVQENTGSAEQRATLAGRLGLLQARLLAAPALDTLAGAIAATHDPTTKLELAITFGKHAFQVDPERGRLEIERVREQVEAGPQHAIALDACVAACAWLAGDHEAHRRALAQIPDDLPGRTSAERLELSVKIHAATMDGSSAPVVRALIRRALPPPGSEEDIGGDAADSVDTLITVGDLELLDRVCRDRMERAVERGDDAAYAHAAVSIGGSEFARGDLREAEATFRLALASPGLPRAGTHLTLRLIGVLLAQGRPDDARAALAAIADQQSQPVAICAAAVALAGGEHASACAGFDAALLRYRTVRRTALSWMDWLPSHADALDAVGRHDQATSLMREYARDSDTWGGIQQRGRSAAALGQRLPGSEGRELLEHAVALLDPSPFRLDAAGARLELGARMRRGGERAAARALMLDALEWSERAGARPLALRLREELALAGSRPRNVIRTGVDALTPAEHRIARLAAGELTNREIAQRLFLTVKTVETHLRSAYRKLDIASRRELAAVLEAPA